MSTRWYYAKAGTNDRQGPVAVEQVQEKLRTGELTGSDIVWRQGMPQWAPIGAMPEFGSAPRPIAPPLPPRAAPVAQPMSAPAAPAPVQPLEGGGVAPTAVPHSVGYFTPGADMPMRARQNLAKFATPTGPLGDWPLNDGHVMQLAEAVKWRKRIIAASGLTRFFFLIYTLIAIVMVCITVAMLVSSKNFARDGLPMLIASAVIVPFAVLFGFAGKAIRYCRSWGALVLAILCTLGLVVQVASLVLVQFAPRSGASSRSDGSELIGGAIGLFIGIAIAVVYWRAYSATPKFLNSPVWCQEALAVAEQSK